MIGSLRHRVELQKKTATRDTYGAETETWVTKATVWAAVLPLSEEEYFTGKIEKSEITHKIVLRYYKGLTPDWRI
ncbi:phage head closure protein, partial [Candidatus Magnetobacterium casense]